jgi:hypothetical protein
MEAARIEPFALVFIGLMLNGHKPMPTFKTVSLSYLKKLPSWLCKKLVEKTRFEMS